MSDLYKPLRIAIPPSIHILPLAVWDEKIVNPNVPRRVSLFIGNDKLISVVKNEIKMLIRNKSRTS